VIDARGRTDRFFEDGPDWLLCFENFTPPKEPSGVTGWFNSVLSRWNLGGPGRTSYRWSLRFVDPETGATRYQLPEPLQITIVVSPDGRYVCCHPRRRSDRSVGRRAVPALADRGYCGIGDDSSHSLASSPAQNQSAGVSLLDKTSLPRQNHHCNPCRHPAQ
jgi:hypothetical protein